jgi:TolA-binding protein
MKRVIIVFEFVLFCIIFNNCAKPVQTRYNPKIPKYETDTRGSDSLTTLQIVDQSPPEETPLPPHSDDSSKRVDTIVIDLTINGSYPLEISRGNELFFNKDYRNALRSFLSYINRANEENYFYWLSKFKIAECLVEINDIDQAIEELSEIASSDNADKGIKEDAIFKLGKIYCNKKDTAKATFYFELLKKEFPNSKYLPTANCN